MIRKTVSIDPRISNDRVGLMITRGQIETLGHTALKAQMLVDNSANIIGFGSSQKSAIYDNPLTSDQKKKAQQGVWGDAFKIVFLQDIGATDRTTDWADYVLDRIKSTRLPEPTDLYAGSKHEARWYEEGFASLQGPPSFIRGMFDVWENKKTGKRIHILDRNKHVPISSSEVRTMIERRDNNWHNFVPQKLWSFYEWEYPPHLRSAIYIDQQTKRDNSGWYPSIAQWNTKLTPDKYPVGTKFIFSDAPDDVYTMRDDGKIRIRTELEETIKSMGD